MTRLFLQVSDCDIRTCTTDEECPPLIVRHKVTQPGLVVKGERVKITAALVQHPPALPAFACRFDCADLTTSCPATTYLHTEECMA